MKTMTDCFVVCPGGLRCRHAGTQEAGRAPHTIHLWGKEGGLLGAEVNGERVVTRDDRVWFSNQAIAKEAIAEHIRTKEARMRLLNQALELA